MQYTLVPFTEDHLEAAVGLFVDNYRQEQAHSPNLPSGLIENPDGIRSALRACLDGPGVAVLQGERLLAYMVTGAQFSWKGQGTAMVPEYGHGAVPGDRWELYQRMYIQLAQEWGDCHLHLHVIGHLAHDGVLQETLYQLGYGAVIAENLRGLSDVPEAPAAPALLIDEEKDMSRLLDLQLEHNRYYARSPIFILKSTDEKEVLAELESRAEAGDVYFVYTEGGEPCAYMIVGESTVDGEGFLLQRTNTAQVKSMYARPGLRGKGIGKALLQRAVEWARLNNYDRLFVEHETANFSGGKFWCRHFTPYLYYSMRYIDTGV